MGFMTGESLEYAKYVHSGKKPSTKQVLYECDLTIWEFEKPKLRNFSSYDDYQCAMRCWYKKKPRIGD